MAERYAVVICPRCRVGQVARLAPVPGGATLDCPLCGRVAYAAALPASDPPVIHPGPRRRPGPPQPPRPTGRPRKAA